MIVEAVLPAIKAVGKVETKSVLSGVKQHNRIEIYQTTLRGLHSNFSFNTRIGDGIVELIPEAVMESAETVVNKGRSLSALPTGWQATGRQSCPLANQDYCYQDSICFTKKFI